MRLLLVLLLMWATPTLLTESSTSTTTTTSTSNPLSPSQLLITRNYFYNNQKPFFELDQIETNLSAQVGSDVYLHCRVRQLGNKSVSFIRSRDSHILTVDRFTFVSDDRFTLLHPSVGLYILHLKSVQPRDSGNYECQITTSPKLSLLYELTVVQPQTRILNAESGLFVKSGSSLLLKCVIYESLEEPSYVFWYHDGLRVLPYGQKNHLLLQQNVERISSDTSLATLLITNVSKVDAGNYTCAPARGIQQDSILVHVINEHPAAQIQQQQISISNEDNSMMVSNNGVAIMMIPISHDKTTGAIIFFYNNTSTIMAIMTMLYYYSIMSCYGSNCSC